MSAAHETQNLLQCPSQSPDLNLIITGFKTIQGAKCMIGLTARVHVRHLFSCVSGVAVWAKASVRRLLTLSVTLLLAPEQNTREQKVIHFSNHLYV